MMILVKGILRYAQNDNELDMVSIFMGFPAESAGRMTMGWLVMLNEVKHPLKIVSPDDVSC